MLFSPTAEGLWWSSGEWGPLSAFVGILIRWAVNRHLILLSGVYWHHIRHFPSTTPSPKQPLPQENFAEEAAVAHPDLLQSSATAAWARWVRQRKWVSPTLLSSSFAFEPHHSHTLGGYWVILWKQCNPQKGKGELFSSATVSAGGAFSHMCQQLHNCLKRLLPGLSGLLFCKSICTSGIGFLIEKASVAALYIHCSVCTPERGPTQLLCESWWRSGEILTQLSWSHFLEKEVQVARQSQSEPKHPRTCRDSSIHYCQSLWLTRFGISWLWEMPKQYCNFPFAKALHFVTLQCPA